MVKTLASAFSPFEAVVSLASPFPIASRARSLDFLRHGRYLTSRSPRPFQGSGLRRMMGASYDALCCLLQGDHGHDGPLRAGRSDTPGISRGKNDRLPRYARPDLPPRLLMTVDFAILCSLVRPGRAS